MVHLPDQRLAQLIQRHEGLSAEMSNPALEPSRFVALSKDYAELTPAAEAARLSGLIQAHILSTPAWQNAGQVLIYSPIRNEVDTALLFADALATGKQALFPRCLPGKTGIMELAACAGRVTKELAERALLTWAAKPEFFRYAGPTTRASVVEAINLKSAQTGVIAINSDTAR